MSRRNHKKKNITLAKEQSGHRPNPVPSSDWEQLAANPVLSSAFRELSVSLQRSQATAEQRAVRSSSGADATEFLAFRHVIAVANQRPQLDRCIRELYPGYPVVMLRESTMLR